MNDLSARFRSGDEQRPPTKRAQAKLQTRERVLQAAKRLFIVRGYEAATIRDIANEAGMSTGAVFANFTDKNDLFHEVIRNDLASQMELIDSFAAHGGPIGTGLAELFAAGYGANIQQLPLLQAATSLSWAQGLGGAAGDRPQGERVVAVIAEMLRRAVDRGELDKGADIRLTAEMLWDAYVANYRRAVFDGWGLDKLNKRMAAQSAVILAGARRAA